MERKCLYLPDNAFVCAHDLDGYHNVSIMGEPVNRTESNRMNRMYILNKMNGNYDNLSNFGCSRRYGINGTNGINGLYKQHRICPSTYDMYNVNVPYYYVHPYFFDTK